MRNVAQKQFCLLQNDSDATCNAEEGNEKSQIKSATVELL